MDLTAANMLLDTAADFGRQAMQAWNFHIIINVAALGWAFNTRKPEHAGFTWPVATAVGVLLFAASALTARNAFGFSASANAAIDAARETISLSSGAQADVLTTFFASLSTKSLTDGFPEPLNQLDPIWIYLAADAVAAFIVGVVLSKVGRSNGAVENA